MLSELLTKDAVLMLTLNIKLVINLYNTAYVHLRM
jgi:hypothetical protein